MKMRVLQVAALLIRTCLLFILCFGRPAFADVVAAKRRLVANQLSVDAVPVDWVQQIAFEDQALRIMGLD